MNVQTLRYHERRGPRAAAERAEVEAKIDHLTRIRATPSAVIAAHCTDLAGCSCDPACPIPFAELDPGRGDCRTGPPPERPRGGGPLPRSDEP